MRQTYGSTAALPTRTYLDTTNPATNEYYSEDLIYFVLADLRGKPRRIMSGAGSRPYSGWEIGSTVTLHHDQEGYLLGVFKVVGWFTAERRAGEIPSRKLPLAVFK